MLPGGRAANLFLVRPPACAAAFVVIIWCKLPRCLPSTSAAGILRCQPAASLPRVDDPKPYPNPFPSPNPKFTLVRLTVNWRVQGVHGPACPARRAPRGIGPSSCLASAASRHRQLRCVPRSYCCHEGSCKMHHRLPTDACIVQSRKPQGTSSGVAHEQACAMSGNVDFELCFTAYFRNDMHGTPTSAWPSAGASGRSPGERSCTDGSPASCSACTPAKCIRRPAGCHTAAMTAAGVMCTPTLRRVA